MRSLAAILLCLLTLTGCDQQAALESFVPQAESVQAKRFLAQLAARDFDAVEAQLDSSLRSPDVSAQLKEVAAQIPRGEPKSITTIGAHTHKVNQNTTYSLTYDYEYAESWLVANVVLEKVGETVRVSGVHTTPTRQSQKSLNEFRFTNKGVLHYVFLTLAVLIPVFCVATIVACQRTKIHKRKWLWYIFIALGFVQISLNWTTGQTNVLPLSFLLLGAGFNQAGPHAPLILTFAVPVGAIVFWLRRKAFAQVSDA
jgi:hypothetical protein